MKEILNFYYPSIENGGLEKNVFSLINNLAEKNYKINFFTFEDNTRKKQFRFNKKINVISSNYIPGINNRYIKYLFCFLRLLISCFFTRGIIVSFQGNVLPIIVSQITRKKIIIRCNTAPSKYINSNFKKIFFKYFYSFSNLILVTSNDFKKEIKKYFNLKSFVHRQTLDIDDIRIKSNKKINFNFFKKYRGLKIINIGRLNYQKDQLTLLRAFKKLINFRKSKLLIIGSGSDKKILKNYVVKNNLQKLVKFVSYTKNPFQYVALSDVKVLSSRFEGNPNILLEIASLKKLIISTDSKVGPKEILQKGKGGILFKVGNDNELFFILKKLNLKSENVKKKIQTSYNYVNKNYQKDISTMFIKLLKNLK